MLNFSFNLNFIFKLIFFISSVPTTENAVQVFVVMEYKDYVKEKEQVVDVNKQLTIKLTI